MSEQYSVGFVGIGTMGGPMARLIKQADYDLGVFDADPDTVKSFCNETGAAALSSVAELAQRDVVVCMLPNGKVVRSVLAELDDGGFLKNAKPGTIVIDMSSAEPIGTRELGKILADKNIIMVDAPVSGGEARAITGELTLMVGGDDKSAIDKIRPLLATMGNNIFDTGGLGTGHAVKTLNNIIAASSFAITSEAMIMAERFGLDTSTLVDVVNVSTGQNFMTDKVMKQHVISGEFATHFALGLLVKDVNIAVDLSEALGVKAPLAKLVRDRWSEALEELGYSADNSEAIKVWGNKKK